jgi:drug/metabolite transporter (DMT)-like permease
MEAKTRATSIMYIQLSNLLFAATAVCIGYLGGKFDGYFTSLCRFIVGAAIGLASLAFTRTPFKINRLKPWLGRGVFGSLGMVLYYLSIVLGSPGRASLLNNSYPVFVAIIAFFILRAKVRLSTVGGILVSFAGIALVLWDGSKSSFLADSAGLASGMVAAVSYHFNKKASQTEDAVVIYLGVCFVGILGTAFSANQFARLDWLSAGLLLLAGLGGYFAQIAITLGLRDIDATEGSVHTFLKIPMTSLGGWLMLSEPLSLRFFLGTLLIFLGLFMDKLVPQRKPPRA